jgi:hypothetical protein
VFYHLLFLGVEVVIKDKLLWIALMHAVKLMMDVIKALIHGHRTISLMTSLGIV